jgi:tol-pal system protein YbgF
MLVGLGAWAKFHNDAEVGTDGFTDFRSSSQANSNASDLAAQKTQEEQDTKEGSVDKDNTVEQRDANAEPKSDDRDQASKEPREELESDTRKARDEDPDRDAYETGRAAYRAGDYRAALGAFSDTVKHSPHGPYASKAQYWIADCWFELHDYRSAVAARQKFIADYPDSSKVPEAMLGLAAAYIELGDASNARKTLAVLIDRFPASQAAWRGHRLLVKLK